MTGASPNTGPQRVDICVCTYRRPGLDDTLLAIGELAVPEGTSVRIIVADNDMTPTARSRVEAQASRLPFEATYVHCPAANISIARNACLDAATGDFIAFIDDDETPSPQWLVELLRGAAGSGADAVLGPVRAVYAEEAPGWMRRGDFHSTLPVWVEGEIRTGYTCNALLRRASPRIAGLRFDPALGRSGGEDTDYFSRLHRRGGTIAFAPRATVFEKVPSQRASFTWLARRRFRMGQTHGRLLAQHGGGAALARQVGVAAAKVGYCLGATALLAPAAATRNRFALRGLLHAGAVGGLLGMRGIVQYGDGSAGAHGNAD
jgi:succinoglycan biosynthesis protein ExoM